MLPNSTIPTAMNLPSLIQAFRAYLYEALAMDVPLSDWEQVDRLPLYLADAFGFKKALIGQRELLAVFDKTGAWTPQALNKQLHQIEQTAKLPTVFATEAMTAGARARLVAQRTPFVVPGQQLYLPMQGIIFKERFSARPVVRERLAFATQALLIAAVLKTRGGPLQPGLMAGLLQYTPMTMTRAFNELQARGWAQGHTQGRKRLMQLKLTGRELWQQAKPVMQTPVRKRLWVTKDAAVKVSRQMKAGFSALAEQTSLAALECPVLALPLAGLDQLGLDAKKNILAYPQRDAVELELWAYPPALFTEGRVVDPLNLYLSLREDGDERVQAALEELEERVW